MNEPRPDFEVVLGGPSAEGRISLPKSDAVALAEAEANHRIANNLSIVAAYLRLQAGELRDRTEPLDPGVVTTMLREGAARVEAVGRLHRRLASGSRARLIDLAGYLEDLCADISASMAYEGEIVFRREGPSCLAPQDKVVPLSLGVLEAVTNAIKYAHPGGVIGRIEISCAVDSENGVSIEVADDGVGLPEGFDPVRDGGLGARVLRSLLGQLGGRVEFDSTGLGLTVRLSVPGGR